MAELEKNRYGAFFDDIKDKITTSLKSTKLNRDQLKIFLNAFVAITFIVINCNSIGNIVYLLGMGYFLFKLNIAIVIDYEIRFMIDSLTILITLAFPILNFIFSVFDIRLISSAYFGYVLPLRDFNSLENFFLNDFYHITFKSAIMITINTISYMYFRRLKVNLILNFYKTIKKESFTLIDFLKY